MNLDNIVVKWGQPPVLFEFLIVAEKDDAHKIAEKKFGQEFVVYHKIEITYADVYGLGLKVDEDIFNVRLVASNAVNFYIPPALLDLVTKKLEELKCKSK